MKNFHFISENIQLLEKIGRIIIVEKQFKNSDCGFRIRKYHESTFPLSLTKGNVTNDE